MVLEFMCQDWSGKIKLNSIWIATPYFIFQPAILLLMIIPSPDCFMFFFKKLFIQCTFTFQTEITSTFSDTYFSFCCKSASYMFKAACLFLSKNGFPWFIIYSTVNIEQALLKVIKCLLPLFWRFIEAFYWKYMNWGGTGPLIFETFLLSGWHFSETPSFARFDIVENVLKWRNLIQTANQFGKLEANQMMG